MIINKTIPKALIIMIINFTIIGCNNNPQKVDQVINQDLDKSITINKTQYDLLYSQLQSDKFSDTNIIKLDRHITDLLSTIDQCNANLKNVDQNSVEAVRNTFMVQGKGDSIYHKLKLVYAIAATSAKSDSVKTYINNQELTVFSLNKEDWINTVFGSNIPVAVIAVLKNLKSEVYNIGSKVFSDY